MSTPPYTTGKTQEGGALATRKQDFNSHVSGGAFYHGADGIMMNPVVVGFEAYTTVQSLLEKVAIDSTASAHGSTVTIGSGNSEGDVNIGDQNINDLGDAIRFIINNIGTRFTQLFNGGTIFIKSGGYTLNTSVTLPAGISLIGECGGATVNLGFDIGYPNPCIRISGGTSSAYLVSYTISPNPRSIRQKKISYIRDLVFTNDPRSASPTLSQATLFYIDTGANVMFDNVCYLGNVTSSLVTKNFIAISDAAPTTDQPYTVVRVNNCYVDTVSKVIEISDSGGDISNTSTVDITNCVFRVANPIVLSDWTGIISLACTSTIQNNKFIRVTNLSTPARPMISFTTGSGVSPTGQLTLMNITNNVAYTVNEAGSLRNTFDVMLDAASLALITNGTFNYSVINSNNTYISTIP